MEKICKCNELKHISTYWLKIFLCTNICTYICSKTTTFNVTIPKFGVCNGLKVKVQRFRDGWCLDHLRSADNIGTELCDRLGCAEMLHWFPMHTQFWDCSEIILCWVFFPKLRDTCQQFFHPNPSVSLQLWTPAASIKRYYSTISMGWNWLTITAGDTV